MIGKITPKGESDPTPEEKLLRAIFGDKAGDVKDASLKASPSLKGVVIGTNLFQRAAKKSSRAVNAILPKIDEEYEKRQADLKDILIGKLMELTAGKTSQGIKDFIGSDILREQKANGLSRRLAAIEYTGKGAPPRAHYAVHVPGGEAIGELTSGVLSPSLMKGIALAYLPAAHAKVGTELEIDVRGRKIPSRGRKKTLL